MPAQPSPSPTARVLPEFLNGASRLSITLVFWNNCSCSTPWRPSTHVYSFLSITQQALLINGPPTWLGGFQAHHGWLGTRGLRHLSSGYKRSLGGKTSPKGAFGLGGGGKVPQSEGKRTLQGKIGSQKVPKSSIQLPGTQALLSRTDRHCRV